MKTSLVSLVIILLILAGCGGQAAAPSAAQASTAQAVTADDTEEVTAESPEEEKDTAKQSETGTAGETTAASKSVTGEVSKAVEEETAGVENTMRLLIGETEVPVAWEENASVMELRELCPLTIQMSMYGGFEQVGPIGQNIAREDVQTVTDFGDIVLYSGNQIVIFYGSNSWAYTRLGHIDLTEKEMRDLLSGGDVTITLE